ncbi:DUF1292 domain-containing protein [Clostridium sp. CTA-7]
MDNENKCGCHEGTGCGNHHEHDHHEGCGCGEDHHEHFVVDLEDDNGNVVSCPIIDAFEFEENEYILAQDPNEDSVYLFRSTEDGELVVPEEEEFDRVSKFYSEELVDEE